MTVKQFEEAKQIEEKINNLLEKKRHIEKCTWGGFGISTSSSQAHCFHYPSGEVARNERSEKQIIVDEFLENLTAYYDKEINKLKNEFQNL